MCLYVIFVKFVFYYNLFFYLVLIFYSYKRIFFDDILYSVEVIGKYPEIVIKFFLNDITNITNFQIKYSNSFVISR